MNRNIQRAFDKAANTYHAAADIQHRAGEKLISLLPRASYHSILDLGCGTGTTTRALAVAFPQSSLFAQDFSAISLAKAREQCTNTRIQYHEANFDEVFHGTKLDLIFSNMALHWSADLLSLLMRCHDALNNGGVLAFTLPLNQTFHELKEMVNIQSFETRETVASLLQQANFHIEHHTDLQWQTQHENGLATLRSIKQTGATVVNERHRHTLSKTQLLTAPTTLTYHLGFFIARKTC